MPLSQCFALRVQWQDVEGFARWAVTNDAFRLRECLAPSDTPNGGPGTPSSPMKGPSIPSPPEKSRGAFNLDQLVSRCTAKPSVSGMAAGMAASATPLLRSTLTGGALSPENSQSASTIHP
jgi:hypothetical protein